VGLDLGVVSGLLQLKDQWTGVLKGAAGGMKGFESAAQASLDAVGGSAEVAATRVAASNAKMVASLDSLADSSARAGTLLSVGLSAPITLIGGLAVKLGMDAIESKNLWEVSFGDMTKAADTWALSLSKNLGLNRFETEKMAGTLFNMTTSMGIGRAAAFELSTGVVKLAADMSSFRNIPMDVALHKIQSGLVGETEGLKTLGIVINDTIIKQYAYTNGIATQGVALTNQQKVLARYGALLQQTSNDQGDLARTLDSPANQLRVLASRVTEAATALGVAMMPTVQLVIRGVSAMIPVIQGAVDWFGRFPVPLQMAAIGLAAVAAAAGPILLVVAGLATGVSGLIGVFTALGIGAAGTAVPIAGVGVSSAAAAAGVGTLGTVAGVTTVALKLMGSAVSVVAVAFASWEIGKWIGENSGLTDWIERTTGKILGLSKEEIEGGMAARKYADAHKPVAGAVADVAVATGLATAAMKAEAEALQLAATATAAKKLADQEAKTSLSISMRWSSSGKSGKVGVVRLLGSTGPWWKESSSTLPPEWNRRILPTYTA